MLKRIVRRAALPAILAAAAALGGCVYSPYPGYYGAPYGYGYSAAPVVTSGVVVGGGYGYYRRPYYYR